MLGLLKYILLHFSELQGNNKNFIDKNFVFAGNDGDVFPICETSESDRTIKAPIFSYKYFGNAIHSYFR